ncbi:MAG: hypothetical protein ACFFDI_13780 [Promethearchaeota archaeon]
MQLSYYRTPLLLFLGGAILFVILLFVLSVSFPIDSVGLDIPPEVLAMDLFLLFCAMLPLSALIGGLLGFILAPMYLFIHQKTIGRKVVYGIEEQAHGPTFNKTFQAFFPALMAINFAMILVSPNIMAFILRPEQIQSPEYVNSFLPSFLGILLLTLGIAMVLFSPTWFLSDAGLVYLNREKVEGKGQPVEARTVGGWYHYLLRGYAGIGVLLSYYQFLSVIITEIEYVSPTDAAVQAVVLISVPTILLLLLPIFLALLTIPAIILLDIMKPFRIDYVRKIAKKLGISKYVRISFEEIG